MRRFIKFFVISVVFCLSGSGFGMDKATAMTGPEGGLDENRIRAIAEILSEKSTCFGRPISDRGPWEKLATKPAFKAVIGEAEKLLEEPIPQTTDDLFLDYSRTGNRGPWQKVRRQRFGRLTNLVLAECLENKGRFISAVKEMVEEFCAERTWVMPAHDKNLNNFNETRIDIDLGSATLARDLTTTDYLLGDKLSGKTRRLIRDSVQRFIFEPFRDMMAGKREASWWLLKQTNNWNVVCLAGVTGSALALLESPKERALFVAASEKYSMNFLISYTPDGYCTEGVGYWNYGYGNYILLSELIYQATGGKIDLMEVKKAAPAAMYAARVEIINGLYPSFSDCSINARPGAREMWYVSRKLKLGLSRWENEDVATTKGGLFEIMMYSFANSASQMPSAAKAFVETPARTWFEDGGVLICRPSEKYPSRLGAVMKGGHNDEEHNHNDVGSYMIVVGEAAPLIDPGAEVYTKRTFSGRRYDSDVLNSYGHPVPVVAGKLQSTGVQAHGRVVRTGFTDEGDTLVLDIRSAYDVPELKKLQREFVYSRKGAGSLRVTDEVVFSEPKSFETALITFGQWRMLDDDSLLVTDDGQSVQVDIEVRGIKSGFEIEAAQINEDLRTDKIAKRLAIKLKEPVTRAAVIMTIRPAN